MGDAIVSYRILPGSDYPYDDYNDGSRPPDCPKPIHHHVNEAARDPASVLRAGNVCRNTDKLNDPVAECSSATASAVQTESAHIP